MKRYNSLAIVVPLMGDSFVLVYLLRVSGILLLFIACFGVAPPNSWVYDVDLDWGGIAYYNRASMCCWNYL